MNPAAHFAMPGVDRDMARLEVLLAESVVLGDAYLDAATTHLLRAGGKRLRPLLAVAAATGGERPATREDLLGGVALELMHLASLYHDDVMDNAAIRRNVESVNARFGNLVAIVAGDYLMACSAGIAADLGAATASLMASTLAWLTRGQTAEVRTAFDLERGEADYFETIRAKTAALMAASCSMGAMTAGHDDRQRDALTDYGWCFGMVYQLRDDVLDLTATDNQLSKPPGQDLAEGIYNLPTLYALEDPSHGDELRALLGRALSDDERERARKLVVATDGVARTLEAARGFLYRADTALEAVASGPLRAGFAALIASLLVDLPTP